jgi:hypothetical protein
MPNWGIVAARSSLLDISLDRAAKNEIVWSLRLSFTSDAAAQSPSQRCGARSAVKKQGSRPLVGLGLRIVPFAVVFEQAPQGGSRLLPARLLTNLGLYAVSLTTVSHSHGTIVQTAAAEVGPPST